ncbi:VIT family protein [Paracoccus sp. P2]|uniref:VIT family protein n=1 Tax=Paracoccus pantotrophus TaxID=82367 RepID=A0A1I5L1W0_PARPN|nr:VIT family protein [Paracoccus pantotrophus]MDF3855970.1 VIT family protein [Paracoccus pantotrophus]QFG35418.1 VIT family protein [Paracoccus pantotrophus]QLH13659.1 VIT family protein [Paracoccus pantotrophus]RKS44366.1 VIT1/CCC1 family predicted Fe2+/Mn2+ transporter [Paracoccus pantotrophus]RNI17058.1 VIT family protein [Paracoccus pantotrophus]
MSKQPSAHPDDPHYVNRMGWLRASVLGANDGIVSTGALIAGVAAADPGREAILIAGLAGLVAGAMSMAMGEYVSVSSQSDTERADIARERTALREMPEAELHELAAIYESRGMSPGTALQAAREVTEHDALAAHVRDELGLSEASNANPLQAALASAATFSIAAAVPLLAAILAPGGQVVASVLVAVLVALGLLGALGAWAGGAPPGRAVLRVMAGGTLALAATAGIGTIFGVAV